MPTRVRSERAQRYPDVGVAVAVFVWAVRRGQFEDLDTPALDILRDDEHERKREPGQRQEPDDAG